MVEKDKKLIDKLKYPTIVVTGSLVLAIILIVAIGNPLWKNLQKSRAELAERKAILTKQEDNLATLESLKDKEKELIEKNEKVIKALPTHKDISRLFVGFEKIATENGLSISGVSESSSANDEALPSGQVSELSYTIQATAPLYSSLKQAFQKTEESLRMLSITGFNISSSGSALNVSININTYVRGE